MVFLVVKRPWSMEENAAIQRHFGSQLIRQQLPSKPAIEECLILEPVLQNRTWTNIKDICRHRMKMLQNKTVKSVFI